MSKELVNLVQEKLKEDSWTRATISNYSEKDLEKLSDIVKSAKAEGCVEEIKEIADEQLSHSKDNISALYISGMLSLKLGSLDNSSLENLVDIFQNNHKESIVIDICEKIRQDDPSNKFALRILASIYEQTSNDKIWEIYEEIIKVDMSEAEYVKKLAEHYASTGEKADAEKSIDYYKKALRRFVNNKNASSASEIWAKLIEIAPDDYDFFLTIQKKVAKAISAEKSTLLMQELYDCYKKKEKWDTAIDILKIILTIDQKDNWARHEIAECYSKKYANHSHVAEYIRSSDLTQSYRNIFEAINDFEKHIAFDAKTFVYHRSWGVGIIQKVEKDILYINFGKAGKKEISLKMAVNALQSLSNDHIWVIKATQHIPGDKKFEELKEQYKNASKEEKVKITTERRKLLVEKFKNDRIWALKTIIKSFDNHCDFKKIKSELVPSILSASEWTTWSNKAKAELENDNSFGVNPSNINEYIVREKKILPEEKYSNEFKAQKSFFSRIDILLKFIWDETTDKSSEYLDEMCNYFTAYLKSFNEVDEHVIASYLLVQFVKQELQDDVPPSLASFQARYTFAELYKEIENPKEMYYTLRGSKKGDLRQLFLESIKMLPNWEDEFIKLLPEICNEATRAKTAIRALSDAGATEKIQKFAVNAFDDPKSYRYVILFLFKECADEDWFKNANISLEKQLIAIVNIISQCYLEIENHVDSTENKKIITNACNLIFGKTGSDQNKYAEYMLGCDMEKMTHMYTLVDDITELDGSRKSILRNRILSKYPDYKFRAKEEKSSAPKGMLVTAAKLEEKKNLLDKMQNVDLPHIAKEVAEAKEKGDLKENAEYIAAKEAQHKLGNDIKRLQEELARAVVFDPTTATTSIISFGTKVTLLDIDSGKEVVYTILGPWESDTAHGVISYMAPLGDKLLDHKKDEKLSFKLNEKRYNLEVKKIELVKID